MSFALGAFFAGMMLRESDFSHRAAVGMLFDPRVLPAEPLRVLAVVGIIVIGKTLAAIVLAFRYPLNTASWASTNLRSV